MHTIQTPGIWILATLGMIALLAIVVAKVLGRRKSFDVPTVGAGTSDIESLKSRYVQQADALLREGHEKVITPNFIAPQLLQVSNSHESSKTASSKLQLQMGHEYFSQGSSPMN